VDCPTCHRHLRWHHPYPGKAVCPACQTGLVILVNQFTGQCSAILREAGAECRMMANWLDYDRVGQDPELSRHIDSLPDQWIDRMMSEMGL
jgi:hypothetical protein